MAQGQNVLGELILKALPELQCYTNFTEFLKALPSIYAVEVPATVTNVIVSNAQPTSSQTTSVWIRLSNSGLVLGIYVFSSGQWIQISPAPNQIIWVYGDSAAPPAGYMTTTQAEAAGLISSTLATALEAEWIAGALTPPSYEYFSVVLI